jgi:phenylacetate-CoA ligase
VQVVPGAGFGAEQEATIVAGFRRRLGEGVQVQVERVDAIAPEKSGKYRYVISRVAAAPAAAAKAAEASHA